MITAAKAWAKRHWPALRLRTILFGVLLITAALPGIGAIGLRVYENTLVRQTEAELVAQGAALAATATVLWPGARPPAAPPPADRSGDWYRPEPTTVDLRTSKILPQRPPPIRTTRSPAVDAALAAARLETVIAQTSRTTLASILVLDQQGLIAAGPDKGGDDSGLPEVRQALAGHPVTQLRRDGDYRSRSAFEWLSRASDLRLHHARPIFVDGHVVGVLLLSRSPRELFRGLYEDRGKIVLGIFAILCLLILLSGLISRGVTRPIEGLSAASRNVAAGHGAIPDTPQTAAIEIRQLYADFRSMAAAIDRRSRYLRDFAAAVSHEFKTPLAGIQGAVELMEDHGDSMSPEERRRFLESISTASRRLSQLVSRLLDLARADMAQARADVSTDLSAVLSAFASDLSEQDFVVTLAGQATGARVAVPLTTIEAVLACLIDNSRKAFAKRVVMDVEDRGDVLVLRITDDGEGAPPADRDRLFEPFFTSRRAEGGTGLGLPIARSLLAASHAAIVLIDSDGGAAFEIDLPKAR